MTRLVSLPTGAEARIRNEVGATAVVFVNGGTARAIPGTWSATSELLAEELAPLHKDVLFVEVRYRVKSWNELESCMDDGAAAVDFSASVGARSCLLVGFSMGGAVSAGIVDHDGVSSVLGLAPWFPEQLPLDGFRSKRLDVVHGAWDRWFPGIPGVSPNSSRVGFERALDLGAEGTYTLIPRGLHGAALRTRSGRLVRLPRWRRWVDLTAQAVERFRVVA